MSWALCTFESTTETYKFTHEDSWKLVKLQQKEKLSTMKSALLVFVGFVAATSSMTLQEMISWQEKDSKGEYSQIMAKHYIESKVIIEKSRGGRFLWNRNWNLGWIWACLHYWKKKDLGQFFHVFMGKNIVASALKSCIKYR